MSSYDTVGQFILSDWFYNMQLACKVMQLVYTITQFELRYWVSAQTSNLNHALR